MWWWRGQTHKIERRLKDLSEFSERDRLGRWMATGSRRPRFDLFLNGLLVLAIVLLLAVIGWLWWTVGPR